MKKSRSIYVVMILALLTAMNQSLSSQVPEQDSLALVALYDSTDGANWTTNTNWLTGQAVSNWYGIRVSNGRVTEIDLSLNNLVGTIPLNFENLTGLTDLNLERNDLSGAFPQEILSLTSLTSLNIRNNSFTGSIPSNIDTLSNLTTLSLYNNPLNGHIPPELGNLLNLTNIRISGTEIDGPIPPELGKLSELTSLGLRQNQLTGSIPPELGDLTNLENLELYGNQLSGEIPAELGNLVKLNRFFLHVNQLTESIPVELGNLTLVDNFRLEGNNLTGTIPAELGNLLNVTILFLSGNQLAGPIPNEMVNLTKLEKFHIYSNELTSLPDLSDLTTLTEFYIQDNKFTFNDIEQNIGIATEFTYSPQDSIGTKQDTIIDIGSGITFTTSAGGDNTTYQWMKDEVEIPGATDSTYTIDSAESTDAGAYICKAANTIVIDLTLYSRPVNLTVSAGVGFADHSVSAPKAFALYQNFPNPFHLTTRIQYAVSSKQFVCLKVYDVFGKEITSLVNEEKPAGEYTVKFDASTLSGGIYFYRLQTGKFSESRKMTRMR